MKSLQNMVRRWSRCAVCGERGMARPWGSLGMAELRIHDCCSWHEFSFKVNGL